MNKILTIVLLLFVFSFQSCKDALDINEKKTFVEQGKTGGELGFGGFIVELYPSGEAGILYAGDVFYRGTYKISGKKLTIKEGSKTTEFKIVSETELRYENTRVLKISQQ